MFLQNSSVEKASAHQQTEVILLVFHWFLSGHRWHVGNKTKASYATKQNKKVFHNLHLKTLAPLLKEIICKGIFFSLQFCTSVATFNIIKSWNRSKKPPKKQCCSITTAGILKQHLVLNLQCTEILELWLSTTQFLL